MMDKKGGASCEHLPERLRRNVYALGKEMKVFLVTWIDDFAISPYVTAKYFLSSVFHFL